MANRVHHEMSQSQSPAPHIASLAVQSRSEHPVLTEMTSDLPFRGMPRSRQASFSRPFKSYQYHQEVPSGSVSPMRQGEFRSFQQQTTSPKRLFDRHSRQDQQQAPFKYAGITSSGSTGYDVSNSPSVRSPDDQTWDTVSALDSENSPQRRTSPPKRSFRDLSNSTTGTNDAMSLEESRYDGGKSRVASGQPLLDIPPGPPPSNAPKKDSIPTPGSSNSTINALSAAIAVGFKPHSQKSSSTTTRNTSMRMPFDGSSPEDDEDRYPRSNSDPSDTKTSTSDRGQRTFLSSPSERSRDAFSPVPERYLVSPLQDTGPLSAKSTDSFNPLLGSENGSPSMSDRVPAGRRPPHLDIKAVRQAEARGSITSLPELIRRATKLAANLEHGRTASRLTMLDMFGTSDRTSSGQRESTYSDLVSSFPAPAANTVRKPRGMQEISQPEQEKTQRSRNKHHEGRGRGNERKRCCGLTVPVFVIVFIAVVLLITAAILLPIFLILVPRQNRPSANLANCPVSNKCQNGGFSLIDNNACSCVCIDGFTGSDCSEESDPGCTTADLSEGTIAYHNATIGNALPSLLSESQAKFGVGVNTSALLATFARNNLTCTSENFLVRFSAETTTNAKRFYILPVAEQARQIEPGGDLRSVETQVTISKRIGRLAARQTNTATLSSTSQRTSPTATISVSAIQNTLVTASSTAPSSTTTSAQPTQSVTNDQIDFAKIVVLYVLAEYKVPNTAVTAQQLIEQFFTTDSLSKGTSTVRVSQFGDAYVTADFEQFTITLPNGDVVGNTS